MVAGDWWLPTSRVVASMVALPDCPRLPIASWVLPTPHTRPAASPTLSVPDILVHFLGCLGLPELDPVVGIKNHDR